MSIEDRDYWREDHARRRRLLPNSWRPLTAAEVKLERVKAKFERVMRAKRAWVLDATLRETKQRETAARLRRFGSYSVGVRLEDRYRAETVQDERFRPGSEVPRWQRAFGIACAFAVIALVALVLLPVIVTPACDLDRWQAMPGGCWDAS